MASIFWCAAAHGAHATADQRAVVHAPAAVQADFADGHHAALFAA
jgi:hypothetical protein